MAYNENTENNGYNSYNNYPTGEPQDGINLGEIWQSIWDFKWWCLLSVAFCMLLAGLYVYRTPSVYTRTAKVIVDESGQNSAMRDITSFSNALYRRSTFSNGVNVYNEVEAFASPDLMESVVRSLGLETSYTEHQTLRKVALDEKKPVQMSIIESPVGGSFSFVLHKAGEQSFVLDEFRINGKPLKGVSVKGNLLDTLDTEIGRIVIYPAGGFEKWSRDITVSWLNTKQKAKGCASALSVSVSNKNNSVVVLRYSDVHARKAENILSSLIDAYNNQWIENTNKTANNTTKFIDERLIVIEKELSEIENNLKNFKEEHNIADVRSEAQLYISQVGDYAQKSFAVQNQLSIMRYLREYLADPANENALIPTNIGLSNGAADSQINEYNKILLNRDVLRANSSENNPLIADMSMTLASMRSAIIRSMDNLISSYNIEAERIKNQEDRLLARISGTTGEELQLIGIQRQQKVKESLYVFLLQKREENELASLVNTSNTRIIQTPTGGAPSSRKNVVYLLAILTGLAIPVAIVIIKRSLDSKVRRKDDLNGLSIPFLAEIPLLKQKSEKKKIRLAKLGLKKKEPEQDTRAIIVKPDSRDSMNEAYRVLRTNIDLMAGRDHKVFLFTSFTPGSGKTFSAMNVAMSMAVKGAKTLLIDLDLRKGSLSKALNKSKTGVSTYLSGMETDLDGMVVKINELLDLLPAGILPPNPAELLLGERFDQLIDQMRDKYEYIFLDCPPIDIVADTAIIARKTDITIFCIRAGMFEKHDLPLIENLYRNDKYPHMALILNGTDYTNKLYGGYGYHIYGKYGYRTYRPYRY
ncbi:MAG: polysaccharide biosynthesis tyrosine autokinase [Bacteroidales bacterium]|nr:polysaccharide biosynthesis tyrosine autokinase [Bacteroidales bacterium]